MEHELHSCNGESCMICNGGLASCNTCRGAEASLTTSCCGRPLSSEEQDRVQAGELDFVDGNFVALGPANNNPTPTKEPGL